MPILKAVQTMKRIVMAHQRKKHLEYLFDCVVKEDVASDATVNFINSSRMFWRHASSDYRKFTGRIARRYESNQPPSTSIVVPVTKSFCTRNTMACATSSALPARGIRFLAVMFLYSVSRSAPLRARIGVSMEPGDTTLMRRGAISGATARTRASTDAPTEDSETWPGLDLRAGAPLTRTIVPSLPRWLAP